MKRIFTLLLAAAVAAGCSTGNKYTIKGNDESLAEMDYVLLQTIENGERNTLDSVAVANNSFVIKGEVETPTAAYLFFGAQTPEDASQAAPMMFQIPVFLEPGNITVGMM